MSRRPNSSTLRKVVEAILSDKGTEFEVFARDAIDEGASIEEITFRLRDVTNVPVSSATVRRWLSAGEEVPA